MDISPRSFQISKDDFVDFQISGMEKAGILKQQLLQTRLSAFGGLCVAAAFAPVWIKVPGLLCTFWALVLLIFIIYTARSKTILLSKIEKNFEKVIQRSDSKRIFSIRTLKIDQQEMVVSTELEQERIKYAGIVETQRNKNMLYPYTSSLSAVLIPVSIFSNETDLQAFLELVNAGKDI